MQKAGTKRSLSLDTIYMEEEITNSVVLGKESFDNEQDDTSEAEETMESEEEDQEQDNEQENVEKEEYKEDQQEDEEKQQGKELTIGGEEEVQHTEPRSKWRGTRSG